MFAKKPLLSKFHNKWKGICCVFYCHFQLPCIVLSESGYSLTGHHSCRRPRAAGYLTGHHRIQLSETRGSWVALQVIIEYSCRRPEAAGTGEIELRAPEQRTTVRTVTINKIYKWSHCPISNLNISLKPEHGMARAELELQRYTVCPPSVYCLAVHDGVQQSRSD